ncbi:hypothetical protein XAP412_510069 [Xanthomonas phaseoli pv. phaseoli]|uniref:Secreted protein n=1 Tax=Xanthomonas campestris pv. phaseoli TaxID=317013 RepID=A0AB38E382_XANCH|nr:hypothetical protein XAP6984_560068 [Xanthomonas phaseoli pv. phaseoli]SON87011.1 hypothetical protein XAP412_510069 [Xanthomonas phaseoli pv. phaseoli]SON91018.1 hypothetical protein XAP7430_520065 [Xanthomonas phaseoli pv. phaseoli]SOO28445.1 hypothetical protein XAP6164_2410013 [Xanthomonas phaseoli pv. phaseoli]
MSRFQQRPGACVGPLCVVLKKIAGSRMRLQAGRASGHFGVARDGMCRPQRTHRVAWRAQRADARQAIQAA